MTADFVRPPADPDSRRSQRRLLEQRATVPAGVARICPRCRQTYTPALRKHFLCAACFAACAAEGVGHAERLDYLA